MIREPNARCADLEHFPASAYLRLREALFFAPERLEAPAFPPDLFDAPPRLLIPAFFFAAGRAIFFAAVFFAGRLAFVVAAFLPAATFFGATFLPAAFFATTVFFTGEAFLAGAVFLATAFLAVPRLLLAPLVARLLPVDRERDPEPLPPPVSAAVSELTSLLKLLFCPSAVSS